MKRASVIIGSLLGCMLFFAATARNENTDLKEKKAPKGVPVVLGSSATGGAVKKQVFDSLVHQHLRSDSGEVTGFSFFLVEYGIYEDSIGNLIRVRDVYSEYCFGDSLTTGLRRSITERVKRGDTAWFERIKVLTPYGREVMGEPLRFASQ
jgi:hypothetical protein